MAIESAFQDITDEDVVINQPAVTRKRGNTAKSYGQRKKGR